MAWFLLKCAWACIIADTLAYLTGYTDRSYLLPIATVLSAAAITLFIIDFVNFWYREGR